MTTPPTRRVGRRALAAGAVWTVPVGTVAVAAPAFAASGQPDCAGPTWVEAAFLSQDWTDDVGWEIDIAMGGALCSLWDMIDLVQMWTTYSAPAENAGTSRLVGSVSPHCRFLTTNDVCSAALGLVVPPVDDQGSSIADDYYSTDPCGRLASDQTFVVVTYSSPSGDSGRARLTPPSAC